MPVPAVAWIVAAAAAGAVVVGTLKRKKDAGTQLQLRPQLLSFGATVEPARSLQVSDFGLRLEQQARIVQLTPQIPADVLAVVASKVLYAGAFDEWIPAMKDLAAAGDEAEQHRGTIESYIWQGLAVGMDGFPKGSRNWASQPLRFNAMAVAVQNELNRTTPLPEQSYRAYPMLRPILQYAIRPIETLPPAAQWLAMRYIQLVEGVGCDDWDLVWVQGHTTREIYSRAPQAVGTSPESCRQLQSVRYNWLLSKLQAMAADPNYGDERFTDELAAKVLELAKQKIVIWPGGPASSPYVDWGYIIGWLVRAYGAAQRGDLDELEGLGKEAGQKATEWGKRPPGEDYGSADMAADLQSFAGELAAGS